LQETEGNCDQQNLGNIIASLAKRAAKCRVYLLLALFAAMLVLFPHTKKCDGCSQPKPQGKYAIRQWRKGKMRQLSQDCSCLTVTPPDMATEALELDACGILNESASNENGPHNFASPHSYRRYPAVPLAFDDVVEEETTMCLLDGDDPRSPVSPPLSTVE
jgi:hypothetical protein